jgi:hypothetical protein
MTRPCAAHLRELASLLRDVLVALYSHVGPGIVKVLGATNMFFLHLGWLLAVYPQARPSYVQFDMHHAAFRSVGGSPPERVFCSFAPGHERVQSQLARERAHVSAVDGHMVGRSLASAEGFVRGVP